MDLVLRRATAADKPRILEISAQIWEGEDYVPGVIDRWLADETGEVVAALQNDVILGFARHSWLLPGFAWFEGIRTDPACQNRGVGQAIARYQLDWAARGGARRIGLSTHVSNPASIHIAESLGFVRVASFVYLEAGRDHPARRAAQPSPQVAPAPPAEAIAYIQQSKSLQVARGWFSHSWKFYPFALGPEAVLSKMEHVLGIRRDGELTALLCAGQPQRGQGEFSLDYLDGDPDGVAALLRHALYLARERTIVEVSVPRWGQEQTSVLGALRRLDFTVWNDWAEDVFVYEMRREA